MQIIFLICLYLGDGYINKMKRTWRLRIALDNRQDLVIDEAIKNLKILFPDNKVNKIPKKNKNYLEISIYSNNIPILFPQHGKGLKSDRKIELKNEQNIIDNNSLMRGLFHSDGSFYVATNKYPRYQFTNKSKDIINIFSECLINNGIEPKSRKRKNDIMDIQIQNELHTN